VNHYLNKKGKKKQMLSYHPVQNPSPLILVLSGGGGGGGGCWWC